MRMMTEEERIEVSRAAHELGRRAGHGAYALAEKYAKEASSSGDSEGAVFWERVVASLQPR